MEVAICYIIIYLAEALILKLYCSVLFIPKRSNRAEILTLLFLYSILFGISFTKNPLLNTSSFLIANFIFLLFSYDVKWSTGLFHAMIATIAMGFSEMVVIGVINNFAINYYSPDHYFNNTMILLFTSKPLYFLFLYTISHLLTKTPEGHGENTVKEIILFSVVPLVSFWIDLIFVSIFHYTDLPPAVSHMITLGSILLLMANFVIYAIYTYSKKKNRQFSDLQLQLQKEHDSVSYYKMLLAHDEAQNILIHDIKKHLQAIAHLSEQGNYAKITSYIKQLSDSSDLQTSTRVCDHEFLNAILCRYMRDCKDRHIDFQADVRSNTLHFVAENDLTSLFCNLLDNAVEAASKYPHAGIQLTVTRKEQAQLTVITLVNSCRMNPFQKNGRLVSTKKDRALHGLGLKSVERIVARYHGNMQLYYEEQEHLFHAVITLKAPD